MGLEATHEIEWKGRRCATLQQATTTLGQFLVQSPNGPPDILLINLGTNDLILLSTLGFHYAVLDFISFCQIHLPGTTLIWCAILPRPFYFGARNQAQFIANSTQLTAMLRQLFFRAGHKVLFFPDIWPGNRALYRYDCRHLSPLGLGIFINYIRGALQYFHFFPIAIQFPGFNM